jgi:hypothetical protein
MKGYNDQQWINVAYATVARTGKVRCEDFQALLGEFLEGDLLSPEARELIGDHGACCKHCAELTARYAQMIDTAGEIDPMTLGFDEDGKWHGKADATATLEG